MTADRTRQELAAALRNKRKSWDPEELREIVADLTPVVERRERQAAAKALRDALWATAAITDAEAVREVVRNRADGIEAT